MWRAGASAAVTMTARAMAVFGECGVRLTAGSGSVYVFCLCDICCVSMFAILLVTSNILLDFAPAEQFTHMTHDT